MSRAEPLWKPLTWDTAFFGINTARILPQRLDEAMLNQVLMETRAWGARVLHYLSCSDDELSVQLAEAAGFHLVDMRVTLEWTTAHIQSAHAPADIVIREYHADDLAGLIAIARNSYHQTRYYYDHHYPRERCDELYAEWIVRSCEGDADNVLVAERNGEAIGYTTCHLLESEQEGQIGLVGIRSDVRGGGIGRLLIEHTQHWFLAQGVRVVSVVTQGRNIAAQRLYQRCGFVTRQVQLWYHKWFDETGVVTKE
jgi:GNAT superfamily N-acetyltransferase